MPGIDIDASREGAPARPPLSFSCSPDGSLLESWRLHLVTKLATGEEKSKDEVCLKQLAREHLVRFLGGIVHAQEQLDSCDGVDESILTRLKECRDYAHANFATALDLFDEKKPKNWHKASSSKNTPESAPPSAFSMQELVQKVATLLNTFDPSLTDEKTPSELGGIYKQLCESFVTDIVPLWKETPAIERRTVQLTGYAYESFMRKYFDFDREEADFESGEYVDSGNASTTDLKYFSFLAYRPAPCGAADLSPMPPVAMEAWNFMAPKIPQRTAEEAARLQKEAAIAKAAQEAATRVSEVRADRGEIARLGAADGSKAVKLVVTAVDEEDELPEEEPMFAPAGEDDVQPIAAVMGASRAYFGESIEEATPVDPDFAPLTQEKPKRSWGLGKYFKAAKTFGDVLLGRGEKKEVNVGSERAQHFVNYGSSGHVQSLMDKRRKLNYKLRFSRTASEGHRHLSSAAHREAVERAEDELVQIQTELDDLKTLSHPFGRLKLALKKARAPFVVTPKAREAVVQRTEAAQGPSMQKRVNALFEEARPQVQPVVQKTAAPAAPKVSRWTRFLGRTKPLGRAVKVATGFAPSRAEEDALATNRGIIFKKGMPRLTQDPRAFARADAQLDRIEGRMRRRRWTSMAAAAVGAFVLGGLAADRMSSSWDTFTDGRVVAMSAMDTGVNSGR